jgi:hypothetical protein
VEKRKRYSRKFQRLAFDTMKDTGDAGAVIPLDDNRNLVLKMHDARIHDGQAERTRELQAEMLIFGVGMRPEGTPHFLFSKSRAVFG